jgi:hypothetical protein
MAFANCSIGCARWKCGFFAMQMVAEERSSQKSVEFIGAHQLFFNELVHEPSFGPHPSMSPPLDRNGDEFLRVDSDSEDEFTIEPNWWRMPVDAAEPNCQVDTHSTSSISSLYSTIVDIDSAEIGDGVGPLASDFKASRPSLHSISTQTSQTGSTSSLEDDACPVSSRQASTGLDSEGQLAHWSQYQYQYPTYSKTMSQPAYTSLALASLLKIESTLTSCKEQVSELEAKAFVTIKDCSCLLDTLCTLASDALELACARCTPGAMEVHTQTNDAIERVAIVLERSSNTEL